MGPGQGILNTGEGHNGIRLYYYTQTIITLFSHFSLLGIQYFFLFTYFFKISVTHKCQMLDWEMDRERKINSNQ